MQMVYKLFFMMLSTKALLGAWYNHRRSLLTVAYCYEPFFFGQPIVKTQIFRTSMACNLGKIKRTFVAFIDIILLKRKSRNSTQSLLVGSWPELLIPNPAQSSSLFSLISVHFSALVCKIGTTTKKNKRSIFNIVESVRLICVGSLYL